MQPPITFTSVKDINKHIRPAAKCIVMLPAGHYFVAHDDSGFTLYRRASAPNDSVVVAVETNDAKFIHELPRENTVWDLGEHKAPATKLMRLFFNEEPFIEIEYRELQTHDVFNLNPNGPVRVRTAKGFLTPDGGYSDGYHHDEVVRFLGRLNMQS